jgi:hypothetical protein
MLGSLFGWLNRREENKDKANQRDHDLKVMGLQFDQQIKLAEAKLQEIDRTAAAGVAVSEADAFKISQAPTTGIGETIKSFARVTITIWILALCTNISVKISALVGGLEAMPIEWLTAQYQFIISEFFCLCGTTVGWFFAARGTSSSKRNSK